MPLIQGCINVNIKRQILQALDDSCKLDNTGSQLCNEFRNDFASMPNCGECEAPSKIHKTPRRLSDYQRHMSVCAKEEGKSVPICAQMWKQGERLDARYHDSGFTNPK